MNAFVPEGRNDRSLAVYCQGCVPSKDPFRRVRCGWAGGIFCQPGREHASRPTQTVPYGTGRSLTVFQATIIPSLRDKGIHASPSSWILAP